VLRIADGIGINLEDVLKQARTTVKEKKK
jgi:Flp pilus assembly protein TadB